MSQSYSACTFSAFSHRPLAAVYVCTDIYKIGLCEVKQQQQQQNF